ncbi:probable glutamate receptor [Polyergus mexicanus]|uniref:probable glutamate receptor n=1 Tax=Polyergus mexicanus TaxID=615972 RepID=UPI0038B4E942
MSRKFSISSLIVFIWITVIFNFVWGQLIRPNYVYEGLIRDIRIYFNNTCIILLHSESNPIETQGLMEADRLLHLQKYLSSTLHIRTAFMDFNMFTTRVGESYHNIKRPLFVLLNDNEDTRNNFVNVSTWITMSYPTWLIFFDNKNNLTDFFFDVYVPFDSKFMVAQSIINETGKEIITEVYQVYKDKELRLNRFGVWDAEDGLKGPPHGLYLRRNDLFGHNLRVASLQDPPVSLFRRNEKNEVIGIYGFFGEIILLLQEKLNCTFTYKEAGSWGMCLPNGSCTGAIGMLKNDEIDFAATEFMMTKQRLSFVTFTTPIFSTKVRPYVKRPKSTSIIKWDAYVAPFSANIWKVIALFIIIISASIVFIQKLFASVHLQDNNSPSRFTEILFFITGAFCNQGMQQSTLDPVRMVHLVTYLTAVIILAAYSAALISFLTVNTFVMPFTTMDGLLKDGSFRCGVIGNSAYYAFLQRSTDKVMSQVFTKLIKKEKKMPTSYLEGIELICKEDKYAFVALDNMAALLQQSVDCKLEPLDIITPATIAMALQRNSPFRGIINIHILLLRDSGILQRLLETQWSVQLGASTSSWKSVEIGDIMPLLFFIIIALFVSYLIYIIEHITYKIYQAGQVKSQQSKK